MCSSYIEVRKQSGGGVVVVACGCWCAVGGDVFFMAAYCMMIVAGGTNPTFM